METTTKKLTQEEQVFKQLPEKFTVISVIKYLKQLRSLNPDDEAVHLINKFRHQGLIESEGTTTREIPNGETLTLDVYSKKDKEKEEEIVTRKKYPLIKDLFPKLPKTFTKEDVLKEFDRLKIVHKDPNKSCHNFISTLKKKGWIEKYGKKRFRKLDTTKKPVKKSARTPTKTSKTVEEPKQENIENVFDIVSCQAMTLHEARVKITDINGKVHKIEGTFTHTIEK